jgi:DNA-binding response OmpR family regulator
VDEHNQTMSEDRDFGGQVSMPPPVSVRDESADAAAAPAGRVLIVDDNHDAAESLAMLVELIGNEAQVAYDGASALALLDEFRPSLILLDLTMPGMSGFDVARAVRARAAHAGIRLVALSGRSADETQAATRAAGFDGQVVKPVDLPTLTALLAGSAPT